MSDDFDIRIRAALPGIPEDAILHQRVNWQDTHIMRRILISENERKITEELRCLESCPLEKVKEIQGAIRGLRQSIATINSIGVKPHQNQ